MNTKVDPFFGLVLWYVQNMFFQAVESECWQKNLEFCGFQIHVAFWGLLR